MEGTAAGDGGAPFTVAVAAVAVPAPHMHTSLSAPTHSSPSAPTPEICVQEETPEAGDMRTSIVRCFTAFISKPQDPKLAPSTASFSVSGAAIPGSGVQLSSQKVVQPGQNSSQRFCKEQVRAHDILRSHLSMGGPRPYDGGGPP